MKKNLFNLFTFISIINVAISQDGITMKVQGDATDYSSGHSPYVLQVTDANDNVIDIDVQNNTGSTVSWRLIRYYENVLPSTWENAICFGQTCFPPSTQNPYCTPDNDINHPNNKLTLTNGQTGVIHFHILAADMGSGAYKIYLGPDCTNFADSMSIVFSYSAGLNNLKDSPNFSMHPNPSNDIVTINVANSENGSVKLVDLLGNVIYSNSINNVIYINTADFKNGVYFVTVEANGVRYSSRKLIIKH